MDPRRAGAAVIPLLVLLGGAWGAELPSLQVTDLNGRSLQLPDQLDGERSLLLVGFTRAQQEEVDTWLPHRQALAPVEVYQAPVMGEQPGLLRGIITSAMKAEFRDSGERARMIPLWVEQEAMVAALELTDTSQMLAVLVDRQGRVLWSVRGPATQEKVGAIPE